MELFGYGKLDTCCAAAGAQFADTAYGFAVRVSLQSCKCHPGREKQWLVVLSTNCLDTVRFEGLTAVLLEIQTFCDMMLCCGMSWP